MPVVKTRILGVLSRLDGLYKRNSTEPELLTFYAKIALIELCGWIELSMDELIRIGTKKLKNINSINYRDKKIIAHTNGFHYNYHFKKLLIESLGIVNFERIEKKINGPLFLQMESSLQTLWNLRCSHAHTYIQGTTTILEAPEKIIIHFNSIYLGLKDFEKIIKRVC